VRSNADFQDRRRSGDCSNDFGTESIPNVYKIFGPGNQYVVAAKEYAQNYNIAIDMPAGPSEVLVIADEKAVPEFCAADLLSQAEHGSDSQVIFLSTDEKILNETILKPKNSLKHFQEMKWQQNL
jgi:histidinol dehydrogenase